MDNRRNLSLIESLRLAGSESTDKVRPRPNAPEGGVGARRRSKAPDAESTDELRADAGGVPEKGYAREMSPGGEMRALPEVEPSSIAFPRLPQRRRGSSLGGIISFCLCVVLPTILAAVYFIGFASKQYVVEWRFTVRDTNTATTTSSAASTLTALLGGSSSASLPDNYMVAEYIKSEQAVIDLDKRIGLRARYERPDIDFWSRFDSTLPLEKFVRYWTYMVRASFDQITGTSVAQVRAFSAADAYLIGQTLVELTEDLVNEVAQRPLREAVHYAEAEVARAESRMKKVRVDLAEYRNTAAVIDPNSSVVLSNATVASSLRQMIAQYQADMGTMMQGGLGQNASQVQGIKRRIKATQDQLKEVESDIARRKEGNDPLSQVVGRYEELDVERQFAQNLLQSTVQSLEQARANAMARRVFVVPFVQPVLPESSTYPNRAVSILTVAGACLLLWTIALLVGRSIREHLA